MIGNAKQLLNNDKYNDKEILCKFGRTDDFQRRVAQHSKKYKEELKVDIQVLSYSIIDPKNISEAETQLSHCLESSKICYKKEKELVIIEIKYLERCQLSLLN